MSRPEPVLIDLNNPSPEAIAQLRQRSTKTSKSSTQKPGKGSSSSKSFANPTKGPLIQEIGADETAEDVFEAQDEPAEDVKLHVNDEEEDDFELTPFQEELLEAFLWFMLGCFLFAGFDVAAHAQYAQHTTILSELGRVGNFAPGLAFVVFYTNRYSHTSLGQLQLFTMSAFGGSYMIHTLNVASYLKILHQVPALGVLWVWAVWKLPLGQAVLSLLVVAGFSWYMSLDFFTLKV